MLNCLESWPGAATGWLLEHGLPAGELDLLTDKLTVEVGTE